jgi:hypothetical protein
LGQGKLKTSCLLFTSVLILGVSGCNNSSSSLFSLLLPEKTGISFNNRIVESDTFNILYSEYIYNGGGIGIGDFNNDGLNDLYFAGNMVPNALYLNRGNFYFEDITDKAGIGAEDLWSLGVSVVDINNDGWMDIYVTASFKSEDENRKNKLFINQGLIEGNPLFIEKAFEYGIDDDSFTTQGIFFDYDLDGDLDLYNMTNGNLGKRERMNEKMKIWERSVLLDKLYRNDGNGKFSDVSREAGIIYEGYGLGIAVLDVNKDNYPDLYIANDFVFSDVFYVNNGNGTFSNLIDVYFKHISYASMGMDASDINNDGLVDIMTLDMLPSDIMNVKRMYSTTAFNRDEILQQAGYYIQFIRNCLQYNNGNGTFSDISSIQTGAGALFLLISIMMDLKIWRSPMAFPEILQTGIMPPGYWEGLAWLRILKCYCLIYRIIRQKISFSSTMKGAISRMFRKNGEFRLLPTQMALLLLIWTMMEILTM